MGSGSALRLSRPTAPCSSPERVETKTMDNRVTAVTLGVADGHPWEVAHNPGWILADDGSVHLPG